MVMKLIYDYILQEVTNAPDAEINFSVIGLIYDYILKDTFHTFLSLLSFFIIISYSITFSINIYREINFRETKKKEYLKSMGVKERAFFFSSFIRSFNINLVHSLLGSLMVKLALKQSQYGYLFIIFFLFGLVIFSMTYFFQSFLQESRKGVILSLLCFCVMSFLYLPINSPEIPKMIIYLFCILFPPTNLILGLNALYIFEKEFFYFNNNIKMDVAQVTILQMILFFIISFFLYLILGYIISQLFCYKYGISKFSCRKKKVIQNYDNKILNNINIKSNDDLISRTDKRSDFGNLSNIEEENLEEEEPVHHNPEKSKKKKELMVMTYDLMNTPETSPAYSKKIEYLKSSLLKNYNPNNKNLPGNKGNFEDDFIRNEFETDLDNINELQEIRNRRRQGTKTMYNLNNVEDVINNNLNLSVIKNYLPEQESFLSESIEEMISDSSFISEAKSEKREENEVKLKKGEYNKIKNDINKDSRLEIIGVQKNYGNEYILDGLS